MRLGLGCVGLGGGGGRTVGDDLRLVRGAIDLGVSVFDTADVYGGGSSEHVLGRAIKGRRDDVVIATKAGFVFRSRSPLEQWGRRSAKLVVQRLPRGDGRPGVSFSRSGRGNSYAQQDFSASYLRKAIHASLRRLGTDRIDVFQLHGSERAMPELIGQLADLITVGDVVRIGIGADSVATADQWLGVTGVSMLQVPFGVLDTEAESTTFPAAADSRQEVWVRGVLGGGLLGLAARDPSALAEHPKRARIERLTALASEAGLDGFGLALGFARAHSGSYSTMLIGSSSLEHLAHNVKMLDGPPLPDALVGEVLRIGVEVRAREADGP